MKRAGWLVILAASALRAGALEVTDVYHEPLAFDPSQGQHVEIRFHLSEPAHVRARIFDGRNLQIREISSGRSLPAADQILVWDGKDAQGRRVPPEAYVYTLDAKSAAGAVVEWDLTDHTGGETVEPKRVEWRPDQGTLSYVLSRMARVNVRVGIKDHGPLLRTLVDWVPRGPGVHVEPWDGKDAAGVLDVARDPQLEIAAAAFSLSDNTILVLPAPRSVELIRDLPPPLIERERRKTVPRGMYTHAQQSIGERRDFALKLSLPSGARVGTDGIPVVKGLVAVELGVPESDSERAVAERFETVFFVDKQFAFESETGFIPMTWQWNTDGVGEGVHYLTANLRGYDGHFGMTTIPVRVERAAEDRGR